MNVTVASAGRFHIFDLARQMYRLGVLSRLFTGYPSFKLNANLKKRAKTFPWLMTPYMLAARVGAEKIQNLLYKPMVLSFDNWMANQIQPTDVFHCSSGFGTKSHVTARNQFNALTVCDRGSSHIAFQKGILEEEYQRWGFKFQFGQWGFDREIQEYNECDLIVVPSRFAYQTFLDHGVPENKLACVPYGVDIDIFKPYPKEDNVFRVIYVGALSLRKGIPYLLEACSALNLPNFEIWLVGGITTEIKGILKKYQQVFRYLGFIPRQKLPRIYSQASVFVIASIEEGLALVQAQAMACGIPVIATENSGADDLFSNGVEGFIIPARCTQAIKEKIVYLYEHPDECKHMGMAALKRTRQIGGWDTYGNAMLNVYERHIARRKTCN